MGFGAVVLFGVRFRIAPSCHVLSIPSVAKVQGKRASLPGFFRNPMICPDRWVGISFTTEGVKCYDITVMAREHSTSGVLTTLGPQFDTGALAPLPAKP